MLITVQEGKFPNMYNSYPKFFQKMHISRDSLLSIYLLIQKCCKISRVQILNIERAKGSSFDFFWRCWPIDANIWDWKKPFIQISTQLHLWKLMFSNLLFTELEYKLSHFNEKHDNKFYWWVNKNVDLYCGMFTLPLVSIFYHFCNHEINKRNFFARNKLA